MQVDLYKGLKTVVVLALVIVGQPCHICRAFVIIPVAKDLREKEKHFICFVTLHCCFFCIAEFCCCVEANSHFFAVVGWFGWFCIPNHCLHLLHSVSVCCCWIWWIKRLDWLWWQWDWGEVEALVVAEAVADRLAIPVSSLLSLHSTSYSGWVELVFVLHAHWFSVLRNTHTFNGPFSGTVRVSRYQKGKTNLDFTEARDSEWQWHQVGHMQVCILLQTDNHASTPPLSFYRSDALPAAQLTASKHWRHEHWSK